MSDHIKYRRTTIIISEGRKLYSYEFGPEAPEPTSTMTESEPPEEPKDNEENSTQI